MKQIKSLSLTSLLASASLTYHTTAHTIIAEYGSFIASLGTLFDDYAHAIDLQKRASTKSRGLANTTALNKEDEIRDAYLNRFFKTLSDFMISPIDHEKTNAHTINKEVTRFRGLSNYERNKQTGEVNNMLEILQQPEIKKAITALKMELIVENIRTSNADFETAMNTRINKEAQSENLNAAQQRKATETLYAQVVQKINALAVISTTEEIDDCIDRLNALIEEYNRTIASMRAGGSGNEKRKKKETPQEENGEEEI